MKNSWQKILAVLCAMTMLVGCTFTVLAEDVPAAEAAAEEMILEEASAETEEETADHIEEAEQVPAEEPAAPAEEPAAPAEEPAPVEERVAADKTMQVGSEGSGTVTDSHPYIVRIHSGFSGKVNVDLTASHKVGILFGEEGTVIGREIVSHEVEEEENVHELKFSFSATAGKDYLMYVYFAQNENENEEDVHDASFHIATEKVLKNKEETPAEESETEESAEEPEAEEPAKEIPAEEAPAAEEEPAVEEEPAAEEEPAVEEAPEAEPVEETPAEEEAAEEVPAEEVPAEEPAENTIQEAEPKAAKKASEYIFIDEYGTPLGLEDLDLESVIVAGIVDVRVDPDGMSPIFATLEEGAEILVIRQEDDWYEVLVGDEIGYIYKDALEDTEMEEDGVEDLEAEEVEKKVTIFSSRRTVMTEGETVYLTSKLEGFDGLDVAYQWQCDQGDGFQSIEGATEDTYEYAADTESLYWDWKLLVYYR